MEGKGGRKQGLDLEGREMEERGSTWRGNRWRREECGSWSVGGTVEARMWGEK